MVARAVPQRSHPGVGTFIGRNWRARGAFWFIERTAALLGWTWVPWHVHSVPSSASAVALKRMDTPLETVDRVRREEVCRRHGIARRAWLRPYCLDHVVADTVPLYEAA